MRELPDFSETDAALAGARRVSGRIERKSAAGGRRTGVVDRPVDNLAASSAGANVFRSHDVLVIFRGDAGAIDARAETGGGDVIDPGIDVGFLLGQHASALLLIKEDDGMRGKAFAAGGSNGSLSVGNADFLCVGDGFQFSVKASVEEDEESEACGFDGGAVAAPSVGAFAGRIVEPVASVGERLVESLQVGVSGVGVAVEA